MKKLFFLLALSLCLSKVNAQQVNSDTIKREVRLTCGCGGTKVDQILTVVNGKKMNGKYLNSIHPRLINEFSVLQKDEAVRKYGEIGKDGALIVTLKKEAKWIKVSKLLKRNKIDEKDHHLPVFYNSTALKVDSLLVNKGQAYGVSVVYPGNSGTDEKATKAKYLLITETKN